MAEAPGGRRIGLRLARLPFAEPDHAAQLLAGEPLCWWDASRNEPTDDVAARSIETLARGADPDGALEALAGIAAHPDGGALTRALRTDERFAERLLAVLGVSVALSDQLSTHPDDWRVLLDGESEDTGPEDVAARLAAAVHADAAKPVTGTAGTRARLTGPPAVEALRAAYRRELIAIAGRDLSGELPLEQVMARLADLAGHTLQAALAVAAGGLAPDAAPCRLTIVAMGKAGGRELNYVSDVDVVFVAEAGERDGGEADDRGLVTATTLAGETMRICHAVAWEVDAGLRPEGKDGALVRTVASHEAYYRRWASTWEFQALLKARPVAGDRELGQRYLAAIAPFVWTAAERPDFVADVQAMRRRVLANVPAAIADREVKLGPGGLRDVEFAVQLLQLVHGRGDDSLRVVATLEALAALRDGGYIGREDAGRLIDAYGFLRRVEHRLQLRKLRRTHLVPEEPEQRAWLARALGYRPGPRGDARAEFEADWAQHAREVRRLHEKIFYRPLLEAVARVPSQDLRLSPDEAGRRLAALGFGDPAGALRHIGALTAGVSRRAVLQRALLPVLLSDFADAPDPDGGLLAYRQISDALGATSWYLRLLRDEGAVATRLAYLLGTSRYVARLLQRTPDALAMLADDDELRPREPAEVLATMRDSAARQDDDVAAVAVVRGVRRQELLRTAFADLLGMLDVTQTCAAVSATAAATLDSALQVALRSVAAERGLDALPIRFAVIAMGRLGGEEAGYGSDADVLFVYESLDPDSEQTDGATGVASDVASRLRSLLASPTSSDPPMVIDADLRPEGRNGPLVRSLASYRQYYERWSEPWEAQALLRARFVAGDAELGERFTELIDPIRYPARGLNQRELTEIRRLKGRVDSERLPRGADPNTHTKLGRGGLADIEWTVQLLQLQHAGALPELRTTRTLDGLRAAASAGLITAEQAHTLETAWRSATTLRNAVRLVRDKSEDQLPHQGAALVGVGRAAGYAPGFDPGQVLDDYRRAARRARAVVEQVFYGVSS